MEKELKSLKIENVQIIARKHLRSSVMIGDVVVNDDI